MKGRRGMSVSTKLLSNLLLQNLNNNQTSLIKQFSPFISWRHQNTDGSSLKTLLLDVSHVIPAVTRRLRRVPRLEPHDMLEMLLGFRFESERVGFQVRKLESLWGIFKWVGDQDKGFRHLPASCEVMALMLIRYEMFREVQLLLLMIEKQGVSVNLNEIFCKLVEGYAGAGDLERAVLVYDQMREQNLVPSVMCYRVLVDLLERMERTKLAHRICLDMVELCTNLNNGEMTCIENVVRLLCTNGMIQEARNLIKKVMALGLEPSDLALNEIACGFCDKKDFEDALSFFVETKSLPNVLVGNKILYNLCSSYGIERASLFRLELELLGFRPDEITFGIFIAWCCSEGNLKWAFVYLSEMLSRGLKPDILSYNALIGAVFKENMWKHAQHILDEMVDAGKNPNLSTFKILLAGYCKARQFDEAESMIHKMVNRGLIEYSSRDDPLSKAHILLGLDPSSVKLKRDNDVGFFKTQFFDNLGNGLYLDTDLDEYEKRVNGILDDSARPDLNLLVSKECDRGNFKAAFLLLDEMVRWGQEPSMIIFSALVKGLCATRSQVKACISLVEKLPKLANQLEQEVLNLLVQAYCKCGLACKGRMILNKMLLRDLAVSNETYTSLMFGLCKRGNLRDIHYCWDMARSRKWIPVLNDFQSLVERLFHRDMLKEALELLESMMVFYPQSRLEIFHSFLEKFCFTGFSSIAHLMVEELRQKGLALDDITYNHLLTGLCKERKYEVAFTILDVILAQCLVPSMDVSLILIPQLCKADRLETAIALRDIYLRQQSMFPISVDGALMKGFCMKGKVGEAANMFQDMLLKGLHPDAEIYSMVFRGYCQTKNVRKVKEFLGVLMRKYSSISMSNYRNWVRLMCAEGRVADALNLKELMLLESKSHSVIIYNILVFYLLSSGKTSVVIDILNELTEKGLPLDEVTYNFLVYGFSKCNDMSCWRYLSTMILKGLTPSHRSLCSVTNYLFDNGELTKVLDLNQEMESRGWVHGSIVQNAVVEGLVSRNKLQEAEDFLDRMADKGLIPDAINYDNLIKLFCYHGRLNKSIDLLNIMLRKGNIPNSTSYDSVILGLCASDHLNQAMEFHTEMLDRELKPNIKTWDLLIWKLCQQAQTAEAEKLLISMVQAGETPSRLMFGYLIDRYHDENNPRKASEIVQMMQQSGYEPDFDAQWSLITNLSNSNANDNDNTNQGFLSRLLTGHGFSFKRDSKKKMGF